MKILIIILLSLSLFSCKNPVNPFIPENITNSGTKEEYIKTVTSTISLPNCLKIQNSI